MRILVFATLLAVSNSVWAAPSVTSVMKTENLGKPLKSLGLGAPPETEYLIHSYQVNGCKVDVEVKNDLSKTIVALSIAATSSCQSAQLSEVFKGQKTPNLTTLTFGQLTSVMGAARYTADCLSLCGNAYDPSVYASWDVLVAEVVLVNGPAIDASMNWEKAIDSKYGEDYVVDNRFNCTQEFDALAAQEFKNVKVTKLTLRQPSPKRECQAK